MLRDIDGWSGGACRVWWQAHRCSGGAKRVGMSFDIYRSKFTTSLCHAYFVRWNSYTFFDEVASPDRVMKYRDSTYRPPLPHLLFFAADTGAAAKDTETSLHPGCHTCVYDTVFDLITIDHSMYRICVTAHIHFQVLQSIDIKDGKYHDILENIMIFWYFDWYLIFLIFWYFWFFAKAIKSETFWYVKFFDILIFLTFWVKTTTSETVYQTCVFRHISQFKQLKRKYGFKKTMLSCFFDAQTYHVLVIHHSSTL